MHLLSQAQTVDSCMEVWRILTISTFVSLLLLLFHFFLFLFPLKAKKKISWNISQCLMSDEICAKNPCQRVRKKLNSEAVV